MPPMGMKYSRCVRLEKSGRVAQLVEQCPFKAWVAGSSPAALTMISKPVEVFTASSLFNICDQSGTLAGILQLLQRSLVCCGPIAQVGGDILQDNLPVSDCLLLIT